MKILLIVIMLLVVIAVFLYWQNNDIVVSEYTIQSEKLPEVFSGYKILQISDLHNKDFGGQIINEIKTINPDIIVITGDSIDARNPNVEIVLDFLKKITRIAPVYFVSGNHEARLEGYDDIVKQLVDTGTIVLNDEAVTIEQDGAKLKLIGLSDPAFSDNKIMRESLTMLNKNNSDFTILLAHRPDLFDIYAEAKMDIVFSGHAHGGQFRIPFTHQGLFAPAQGYLPQYTEGVHTRNNTKLVISRGLGPSSFPFRLFNRPELVVVTLEKS